MNFRSLFAAASACIALIGHALPTLAQTETCAVGDHECLSQRFGMACTRVSDGANAQRCAAWLAELQGRPDVSAGEGQRTLGYTYSVLARLSDDPALAEWYRQQAAITFRQRLEEDPADLLAVGGLSTNTTIEGEAFEYMRRAAAALDPTDLAAVESLASRLTGHGGIVGLFERLDLQERAYASADPSDDDVHLRLSLGIQVSYQMLLGRFARMEPPADREQIAAVEARHAAFVRQLYRDLRVAERLSEIVNTPFDDAGRTTTSLSTLCAANALRVLGPRACMEALTALTEAVATSEGSAAATRLADALGSTMGSIAGWRVQNAYPDWWDRFLAHLTRLMASGMDTRSVYTAFLRLEDDPVARLTALQQAVAMFPTDDEFAHALGWEYLRRDRRDEAIAQLLIALDNVPDERRARVERALRIARGEEEMPVIERAPPRRELQ